jgi:succinate dehydrogenase / fumarate reductase, cytochrome b subunit
MADIRDARQAAMVGGRTDGSPVTRPLSPHLQVYDMLQMTSLLSIGGRITGAAWSLGLVLLVWWLVAAAAGPEAYAGVQWVLGSWIGLLALFGMSAAAWYHTLNGIRHLAWDAGYGFDIPAVYRSGRLVVVATVASTLLTWVAAFVIWA